MYDVYAFGVANAERGRATAAAHKSRTIIIIILSDNTVKLIGIIKDSIESWSGGICAQRLPQPHVGACVSVIQFQQEIALQFSIVLFVLVDDDDDAIGITSIGFIDARPEH